MANIPFIACVWGIEQYDCTKVFFDGLAERRTRTANKNKGTIISYSLTFSIRKSTTRFVD